MKLALPAGCHHNPKYFPYKESEILLFEALYGLRVMTKQQWQRISFSHRVQLSMPQGYNVPHQKSTHPMGCLEEFVAIFFPVFRINC